MMTQKQQPTPGPWEVNGALSVWSPGAHSNIATASEPRGKHTSIGYEECGIGSPNLYEAVANARLIAAAPDLLAALELVLAHEGRFTGGDWAFIHAAIAKAKGGA